MTKQKKRPVDSTLVDLAKATALTMELFHPASATYWLWSISMLSIFSPPKKEREHDL